MNTVGTLTIFAFGGGGGNYLFWLLNSQASAHSGREAVVEQIILAASSREKGVHKEARAFF